MRVKEHVVTDEVLALFISLLSTSSSPLTLPPPSLLFAHFCLTHPLHLFTYHSTVTDTRTPADSCWATNLTRFSVSIKSSNKLSNAFKYVLVLTHPLLLFIYLPNSYSICLITFSNSVASFLLLLLLHFF